MKETERRRKLQEEYNKQHGIIPKTIIKEISNSLEISKKVDDGKLKKEDIPKEIEKLTAMMKIASNSLEFERAMEIRDKILKLRKQLERKR